MSPLWWLALVPLLAVPLTYLLRQHRLLAGGLAAGACFAAAALSLALPMDETTELLGRLFALSTTGRLILLFIFPLAAVLSLYPWPASGAESFLPLTLLGAGLVTMGILARSLPLSVLFLELGALSLLVLIPVGGSSARAATGYLILVVVGMPCLLLAGWLIEGYSPVPESAWALRPIAVLLAVGLGLILGLVPFHGWWTGLVAEASPAVTALVGAAFPGVVLGVLVSVLGRFPWMLDEELTRPALLGLGLLSAAVGGVLGLLPDPGPWSSRPDRRLRRVLGWWAVHDLGITVAGVGVGSLTGLMGAALGLLSRGLALVLVAMGLSTSESNWRLPWWLKDLAILAGGWTLVGAPLSAAFPGRWLVYLAAFDHEPALGYLLVLSSGLAVVSFLRGVRIIMAASRLEEPVPRPQEHLSSQGHEIALTTVQTLLIAALFILVVCLGLFPQVVMRLVLPQIGI